MILQIFALTFQAPARLSQQKMKHQLRRRGYKTDSLLMELIDGVNTYQGVRNRVPELEFWARS
jgi:hypothetical protein